MIQTNLSSYKHLFHLIWKIRKEILNINLEISINNGNKELNLQINHFKTMVMYQKIQTVKITTVVISI